MPVTDRIELTALFCLFNVFSAPAFFFDVHGTGCALCITAGSAAQFYLRFGTVSLCKGKSALYHKMMQRGQTYHRLGLTGFQSMEGITARKDLRILSTEKYQHVLKRTLEARIIRFKWWAIAGTVRCPVLIRRNSATGYTSTAWSGVSSPV
ncbi:hypothetical protein [Citrobacter telavivensis]|uniref:hypothetical protein n=1 Tax=Citrobacter telavivensis TaxID=2653932 RepID=UPI001F3F45FC|nr:hypothetical protein [Citrobacter telavivensis]